MRDYPTVPTMRAGRPALARLGRLLLILALVATMLPLGAPTAHAAGTVSITPTSQSTLWVDANKCSAQGQRAAWLSFVVKNTGVTTLTDVTVTFAGFTGANAAYFKAPSDTVRTFSTLAPGEEVPVYYYVDYAEVCNHSQGGGTPYAGYTANYTISVASPTLTTSPAVYSGTVTTNELLTAAAAGLALSSTLGPGIYVGQILTQNVVYSFGNNTDLFFQPAYEAGFQEQCIRLVGSEITAVSGSVSTSLIGLKNQLWFPTASVTGGGGTISLTYSWQILCTSTSQVVHPWAAAQSGNKYKYDNSGGVSGTFPPATQPLTIAKSVTPTTIMSPVPGDTVQYTVLFTNNASVPIVLKSITDQLPACMTVANPAATDSQVTAANSSSIPAVGAAGTLQWVGKSLGNSANTTYQVPAAAGTPTVAGTLTLIYTANVYGCPVPSTQTNSATGQVGSTPVGPATAPIGIGQPGAVLLRTLEAAPQSPWQALLTLLRQLAQPATR
jgi:uncharacterized repeat protein (TIGR01451 family)